ncbi:hypothetical protein [Bryobacter aggregatus]|uniref:hypothetical protein n=1 Tax=Bryobacter aggregatus TaxID=360054 RepID=UPI00068AF19D|nr:hypothetical protein [Bryobacter aggregatus]
MKRWLRRSSRWILLAVLSVVIAYEEIQWRLSAIFALLGELPFLRAIEAWVRGLPPYGALALFGIPTLILLPMKILAVYWLAEDKKMLALATLFAAKIIGTALVARIFQLTKKALLSIGWCRWVHDKVMALRDAAYEIWRRMPAVRWWRARWARRMREGGVWQRRWAALRARVERQGPPR